MSDQDELLVVTDRAYKPVQAMTALDRNGKLIYGPRGELLFAPPDFDIQRFVDFGKSISALPLHRKFLAMKAAFEPGAPLDLQRSFEGRTNQEMVRSFKPLASYAYAVAGKYAGLSDFVVRGGGGGQNFISTVSNLTRWKKLPDTSGPLFNDPENAELFQRAFDDFEAGRFDGIDRRRRPSRESGDVRVPPRAETPVLQPWAPSSGDKSDAASGESRSPALRGLLDPAPLDAEGIHWSRGSSSSEGLFDPIQIARQRSPAPLALVPPPLPEVRMSPSAVPVNTRPAQGAGVPPWLAGFAMEKSPLESALQSHPSSFDERFDAVLSPQAMIGANQFLPMLLGGGALAPLSFALPHPFRRDD